MTTTIPLMMPKPKGVWAKGMYFVSTFIPYIPEITVGIAKISVMEVRIFITLFSRLSKIVDISWRVPSTMLR